MRFLATLCALVLASAASSAHASPFALRYAGRVTKADGAPVLGPVRVELRFFRSATGSTAVPLTLPPIDGVPMVGGMFDLALDMTPADYHMVFNGTDEVWIEALVGGVPLPRQRYSAVPFALKIPVDPSSFAYDNDGRLKLVPGAVTESQIAGTLATTKITGLDTALAGKAPLAHTHAMGDVTGLGAALAAKSDTTHDHALAGDVEALALATTKVVKLQGLPVDADPPASGEILKWDGAKWSPAPDENGTAGQTESTTASNVGAGQGVYKGPSAYDLEFKSIVAGAGIGVAGGTNEITLSLNTNATTSLPVGTLRLQELAVNGSDYVALKAPDLLGGTLTFTLPAADGAAGQLLSTNGAAQLGWVTPVATVAGRTGAVTLTTTDVTEGTGQYFTNARARAAVSATAPLAFDGGTGIFSMPAAATAQNGYLTSTDWNTFNNKQNTLGAASGDLTGTYPALTIAANAVTDTKIAANAVIEAKIADGAVTTNKLGALAVTDTKLAANAVIEAKIADGAVTTNKLGALAVTDTKLAANAVIEAKIADGAVTTNKLGALAVTDTKLAANAVIEAKIADGAVTANKIGTGAISDTHIATGANIGLGKLAAGGATSGQYLRWNGSAWAPFTFPSGATSCDLGTFMTGINADGTLACSNLNITYTKISVGYLHACAVTSDHTARCWGAGNNGRLGNKSTANSTKPVAVRLASGALLQRVIAISAGFTSTCAISGTGSPGTEGTVWCWGHNANGQLGDNTVVAKTHAVQVVGITNATQISVGSYHACARLADGTAKCWGAGGSWRLGNGLTTQANAPVTVLSAAATTMTGVAGITAGNASTCTWMAAGGALCWGYNGYYQVGDGTATARQYGVTPTGMTAGITKVVTGMSYHSSNAYGHTCAIKSGDLWCWGLGTNGEQGDGAAATNTVPTQVTLADTDDDTQIDDAFDGVTDVSVGGYHTCAIANPDATIYCWGFATDKAVTHSTTGAVTRPSKVRNPDDSDWMKNAIAVGINTSGGGHTFSMGLYNDAETGSNVLAGWGANTYGQLGNETTTGTGTSVPSVTLAP